MRSLAAFLALVLLAACGPSQIAQSNQAPEQPGIEAVQLASVPQDALTLPNDCRSIKFAVIGDSGRGSKEQHEVAAKMEAYRQRFDFQFVLMVGDNIYKARQRPMTTARPA